MLSNLLKNNRREHGRMGDISPLLSHHKHHALPDMLMNIQWLCFTHNNFRFLISRTLENIDYLTEMDIINLKHRWYRWNKQNDGSLGFLLLLFLCLLYSRFLVGATSMARSISVFMLEAEAVATGLIRGDHVQSVALTGGSHRTKAWKLPESLQE